MDLQKSKAIKCKKPYFAPTRKEPLVKRMIFDSNEAQVPSSCFELRPLHDNESNQQEIIFDSKSSSSLKQISQFDKYSPPEFQKIIYGHAQQPIHNQSIYIECSREANSPHFSAKSQQANESSSFVSYSLKRQNPISHEEVKNCETIAKKVRLNDKQINAYQNQSEKKQQNNFSLKLQFSKEPQIHQKVKKSKAKGPTTVRKGRQLQRTQKKKITSNEIIENAGQEKLYAEEYASLSEQSSHQQIQDKIKIQEYFPGLDSSKKSSTSRSKISRKKAENPEFQLINQYMELASYASLIDEMILVYDRSPLFQFPLDFDSQTEESEADSKDQSKIKKQQESSDQIYIDFQNKIKLQSNQLQDSEEELSDALRTQKYGNQLYNKFQRLRIEQAPSIKEKQKIIKQIQFNRTKTYLNFYEPIQELKPYVKKMTAEDKKLFLAFKKQLKEIKDIIDYFQRKNQGEKKDHVCKICGQEFKSGRQLGGHMSRKHPGKAIEYGFRRQLHKVKEIQRNRRKYFKELEDEEAVKMEEE